MSNVLGEQRDRFGPRNTFLYAALGLVSLSLRAERTVSAALPAEPAPPVDPEGDSAIRYALLGVLGLARTLRAQAERAKAPCAMPVSPPKIHAPASLAPRDLAR